MKEENQFLRQTPSVEKVEEYELPVTLTTNATLQEVCNKISIAQPDWDSIIDKHRQSGSIYSNGVHGKLAELFLGEILEEVSQTNPKVDIEPIKGAQTTDNFNFTTNARNGYIAYKDKQAFAEYDSIILADSLPVVFESKIMTRMNRSSGERNSLKYALTQKKVTQVFQPLQEHFQTDTFGYVLIRPPEPRYGTVSELQTQFKDAGGIIVGLAVTTDEFKQAVNSFTFHELQKKFNSRS